MRKKNQKQMPLMACDIEHPRAKDLDRISRILDSISTITDMVLQDLTHNPNPPSNRRQGEFVVCGETFFTRAPLLCLR
jgi:hypothetical protein